MKALTSGTPRLQDTEPRPDGPRRACKRIFPPGGRPGEASEVLSNGKSMKSSFPFSKRNASEGFSCSRFILPTKAKGDGRDPGILPTDFKPHAVFLVQNMSAHVHPTLQALSVGYEGRGGRGELFCGEPSGDRNDVERRSHKF